MSIETDCETEIRALHAFFAAWYAGEREHGAFDRVADALADGFVLVDPDGEIHARAPLLSAIEEGYGSDSSFEIRIENVRVRWTDGDRCLATYEEWQRSEQRYAVEETGRLSSALFTRSPDAPGGLAWLHVHETWLPEAGPE